MRKEISELYEEAKTIRRKLHTIPEEGFKEFKTSEFLQDYLLNLGVQVERVATTGVVGFIKGESGLDTIAFRGDMDGLSVAEENRTDYTSNHPGMMHACGHDGHMTMLLLFAKFIVTKMLVPKKNILLIFQPAEEGPGGARQIIEEGILKKYNVKKIFACHIMPTIDEGKVGCKPGALMAQTGEFAINVKGKGSHAASPHKGTDAIIIGANLINSLQTIVSRSVDPIETALFSIGTIKGGSRVNVIAEELKFTGTMRAFDESTYLSMKDRLIEITKGYETAFACTIECEVIDMYPPVNNPLPLYEEFTSILEDVVYEEVVPKMIAEDFSYYQKEIPGLFFYLGSRNIEKDFIYDLHHSKFNFCEEILLTGVELYSRIVERQI